MVRKVILYCMKKILLLSFYFPPDLCAGSFRMEALYKELLKVENISVDIITTMPNRYHQYQQEAKQSETQNNINIHRILLPKHQSGFVDQAKAFMRYFYQTKKLTKSKQYDLVFATSSRLFTALLGSYIARKQKCPLFLDIRDIFTETMESVLKFPLKQLCLPWFYLAEKYTFSRANHLNLVSKGFDGYFKNKISSNCPITFISNGVDVCFKEIDYAANNNTVKQVVYAGNIGEGQGIEKIIPAIAKATTGKYEFTIIGSGGRLGSLKENCQNIENVTLLEPVERSELIKHYQKADVLFLHLNDYSAFKRVLPSKIFEYAITGKPILAGVPGYSAEFIKENIQGSYLFSPCDAGQGIEQLEKILKDNYWHYDREDFYQKFNRERLMTQLTGHILDTLQ